jgi:hypothetical protein
MKKFYLLLLTFLLIGDTTLGATLSMEPRDTNVSLGETLELSLVLYAEEDDVNALEGSITFPKEAFHIISINDGGSIIDFWIEDPHEVNGGVSFSGIIPGGFRGTIVSFEGDVGLGKIMTIVVRTRKEGSFSFEPEHIRLLANDGMGTQLSPTLKSANIFVKDTGSFFSRKEILDSSPPEAFDIILTQSSSLHDGKWVALFSTKDTGSGIAHYEVFESTKQQEPNTLDNKNISWKRTQSPYVLEHQTRSHYVYVKAVDNVGNVRIAHALPQAKTISAILFSFFGTIVITVFFILFLRKMTKH